MGYYYRRSDGHGRTRVNIPIFAQGLRFSTDGAIVARSGTIGSTAETKVNPGTLVRLYPEAPSELSVEDSREAGTTAADAGTTAQAAPASALRVLNNHRSVAHPPSNYWGEVGAQVVALTKKNFILAKRNWISTCLRVLASLFFVLLIFGVNEGIKTRLREEAYNKDIPAPEVNSAACPRDVRR
eukprot:2756795-Rhodomonas_salina.1